MTRFPRRRTLSAALAASAVALPLPAASQAANVRVLPDGTLSVAAVPGERNAVSVAMDAQGRFTVTDQSTQPFAFTQCETVSFTTVRCANAAPVAIQRVDVSLGDRDDSFATSVADFTTTVRGETGADVFQGRSEGVGAAGVSFSGGPGFDLASYEGASTAVSVVKDDLANDGRPFSTLKGDNIRTDVEAVTGSRFADTLTGAAVLIGGEVEEFTGGAGDDVITGRAPSSTFRMGATADGADRIFASSTKGSTVDYGQRARGVTVTIGHNGADDGEPGEGDNIQGSRVTTVRTGGGDDVVAAFQRRLTSPCQTCTAPPVPLDVKTGGGADRLQGGDAADRLEGGGGVDRYFGLGADDTILARDDSADQIDCGQGDDEAIRDAADAIVACERGTVAVGVLRLAPRALRAEAGETVRLRLGWRHPQGWRMLRKVELRLTRDGATVGEVVIRPRTERIEADGGIALVRAGRLARSGKTVTARLALRLDESLAGATLKAHVRATDRTGAYQVERDASRIRVAP